MDFHQNPQLPFSDLKNDNYFALIGSASPEVIAITVIDCESEKMIPNYAYFIKDITVFVSTIPFIFKDKFKAVFLCLLNFHPPQFSNNYAFCEIVRSQLKQSNIPHFFTEEENILLANLLIAANISPKIDDTFTTVIIDGKDNLCISELKYTENGYDKNMFCLPSEIQDKNVEKFRQQILGNVNPKKIILISPESGSSLFKLLRNTVLKSKKLIAFEKDFNENMGKAVTEMFKWLKDKSYTRFHIIPRTCKRFTVTDKLDVFNNPLILAYLGEKLPLTKECFFMDSKNIYIYVNHDETMNLLFKLEVKNDSAVNKITFKVDNEGFPSWKIEEYSDVPDVIKAIPSTMDYLHASKLPVIIFFKNYSFVCIFENDKYKFLEAWNETTNEVNIEFFNNKLSLNKNSTKNSESNIFSVKDLIKIMSSNPDKVKKQNFGKFLITNDSYNPILLEFKTSGGEKKVTPPSFLMAYLIKQQIKAIEKETTKRPRKISIWIIDKYNGAERKRIQENFIEACNTLSDAKPKYRFECEFPFFKF